MSMPEKVEDVVAAADGEGKRKKDKKKKKDREGAAAMVRAYVRHG